MSEIATDIRKGLPHSDEAEAALLALFFNDAEETGATCAGRKLTAAHFYDAANGIMFNALMDVWQRGAPIDFATVAAALGSSLETAGGAGRINILTSFTPTFKALGEYLDIIQDRYALREIRRHCLKHATDAHSDDSKSSDVLAGLLGALAGLSGEERRKVPTLAELVKDKVRRIMADEQDKAIIATGITKLDEQSPFRLGSMPLLSGERKAGKSMLALNIAVAIAKTGGRVLYVPLEEPAAEIVDRITARITAIPINFHSKKMLTDGNFDRLNWAVDEIAKLPITIRDDLMDLSAIVAAARQFKAKHPDFTAMFVDYAQLVRVPTTKDTNREQVVATISRTLRQLSRELHIGLCLLCQLNKDGETRESKALEQDCTAMWKLSSPDENTPNERLLHIPFQRGGESNIHFKLAFFGAEARVENFAYEEEAPATNPRKNGKR